MPIYRRQMGPRSKCQRFQRWKRKSLRYIHVYEFFFSPESNRISAVIRLETFYYEGNKNHQVQMKRFLQKKASSQTPFREPHNSAADQHLLIQFHSKAILVAYKETKNLPSFLFMCLPKQEFYLLYLLCKLWWMSWRQRWIPRDRYHDHVTGTALVLVNH